MKSWHKTFVLISFAVLIGAPFGIAIATFVFADGASYLSGNPRACMNCHIMQENFSSWESSTHHGFASCNDCHTSGGLAARYSQKALNGFMHSWAFSTGRFKEPIRIKDFNMRIVRRNCLSCHAQLIESSRFGHAGFEEKTCTDCHQNVGHRKW